MNGPPCPTCGERTLTVVIGSPLYPSEETGNQPWVTCGSCEYMAAVPPDADPFTVAEIDEAAAEGSAFKGIITQKWTWVPYASAWHRDPKVLS